MMKKVTFPITLDYLLMSTPIRLTFDDVYNDIMIQLLKFLVVLYSIICQYEVAFNYNNCGDL